MKCIKEIGVTLCGATMMTSCMSDKTWTQMQGTVIGAAGAALLAAGTVAVSGGDSDDVLKAVAIGAAAGAVAGFAWGTYVVHQKDKYASAEDYLDAHIQALQSYQGELVTMNEKLSGEIAKLQKDRNALSAKEKQALQDAANEGHALISKQLASARQAAGDPEASAHKKQELKQQITSLESQLNTMISYRDQVAML